MSSDRDDRSNGHYDAEGGDLALRQQMGDYEDRQIRLEGKLTLSNAEASQFRQDFYNYRNEVRQWREKTDRMLEAIAAATGAL